MKSTTLPILGLSLSSVYLVAAQGAGTSGSSSNTLFATANVTGYVNAKFNFTYVQGQGVQVNIYDMQDFKDATLKVYPYRIHMNPVQAGSTPSGCGSAMYRLDPMNVTDGLICNRNMPELCQEGDLSGKWGGINAYPLSGSPPPRSYIDPYLRFFPQPFSILGRSIVIETWNGQAVACGNIISTPDGTMNAYGGGPSGANSTYQNDYASISMPAPPRTMNIANGAWGNNVQTSRISAASMTVPQSLPPVSADNNIVLTTDSLGQAMAVAASTTYAPGASLPTQLLIGQTSSTPTPSATIGQGAAGAAVTTSSKTGAACSRAGLASSAAGLVVASLLALVLA